MAETEISKLKIGFQLDSSQLEKGMGHVLSNLNLMQKEFKLSMVQNDKFSGSLKGMKTELDGLKGVIGQQKIALASIQSQYDKTSASQEKNRQLVKDLKAQYEKASKSQGTSAEELEKLKKALDSAESAVKKDEKAMASLHAKHIDMEAQLQRNVNKTDDLTQKIKDQQSPLKNLAKGYKGYQDSMKKTTDKLDSIGRSMNKVTGFAVKSAATIGVAVAGALGFAVSKAAEFEQGLANVGAVSNATTDQMKKLHDQAMDLGVKTKYSATEVTKAQEELIKAGLSVDQVLRDGEAALNLATAGDLELAESAEIAGIAINSFKDEGLNLTHVADKMAGAANASATSVEELKYGMSQSAAVASGLGVSFDDLNLSLAVFANRGLKGSDGGTSLKTMLMRLSPQTDKAFNQMQSLGLITYDATKAMETMNELGLKPASSKYEDVRKSVEKYLISTMDLKAGSTKLRKETEKMMNSQGFTQNAFFETTGELKHQSEIAELLHANMKDLTKEEQQNALMTMFGTDAIRAANIMMKEGSAGYEDMTKKMGKTTAQEVATKKMETFQGAMENFRGAMDSLWITIGEKLLPILTEWIKKINDHMPEIQKKVGDFMDKISKFDWKGLWNSIKDFATEVIPPIVEGIKKVIEFFGSMDKDTLKLIGTIGGIVLAVGPVVSAIGGFIKILKLVTGPIGLVGFAVFEIIKHWEDITAFFKDIGEKVGKFADWVKEKLGIATEDTLDFSNMTQEQLQILGDKFLEYMGVATAALKGIKDAFDKYGFKGTIHKALSVVNEELKALTDGSLGKEIVNGIAKGMKDNKDATVLGEAAKALKNSLLTKMKAAFQIKSPSRLMAKEIGAFLPSGVARGVMQNLAPLKKASDLMLKASIPAIPDMNVPKSARSGVYGGTQTNNNTFAPTVNVNASSPYEYAQATQRMLRRMRFAEGI